MRGPPLGLLLVLLVAMVPAFSGCFSNSGPATVVDPSGGILEQIQEDLPLENRTGTATIRGVVYNENQAPLPDVHIAVFDTSRWVATNRVGEFAFEQIAPGNYTIRADAKDYASLQSTIRVDANKLAKVKIVLTSLVDEGVDGRVHVHDLWGGKTQVTLFDGNVRLTPGLAEGGSNAYVCPGTLNGDWCWRAYVVPEPGAIVLPGTQTIEAMVTWEKKDFVDSVTLQYRSASNDTSQKTVVLSSGTAEQLRVDYDMADNGHQTVTMWEFTLIVKPKLSYGVEFSVSELNSHLVGPFTVKLVAFKGPVIPGEPAHPKFWAKTNRLRLIDNETHFVTGVTNNKDPTRTSCGSGEICYVLPRGKIVPPGTTRLEVKLSAVAGQSAVQPLLAYHPKVVVYRTSEMHPFAAQLANLQVVAATVDHYPDDAQWVLPLMTEQTDSLYQYRSRWLFILADEGFERDLRTVIECPGNQCGIRFTLTVDALNEEGKLATASTVA